VTTATSSQLSRPAPPRPGPPARAVLALAGFEGRRLLQSPVFLGALGLALALCVAVGGGDAVPVLDRDDVETALFLTVLAWGTLLATNLAALRSRRDRTGELLAALPTSAGSRTAAQLLATTAALPAAVAVLAVWGLTRLRDPATVGTPRPAELAVGLLLVAGGGATGVLVARWLPTVLAGPAAVVATIVLQLSWGSRQEWRWLHFVAWDPEVALDPWLDVRPAGWHLLYLAGLVTLAGVLALARDGRDRPLPAVAATTAAVVVLAGWAQTTPPTAAQVAAIVDHLERPEAFQVCQRHGRVRYCAYPTYRDWIQRWRRPVEGVLASLPAEAGAPELLVRQRAWPTVAGHLHPEVQLRLDQERAWPADGAVHPGLDWYLPGNPKVVLTLQQAELSLAAQAAAWAVGLPPVAAWPDGPCDTGGQARTVAALWLAGQATPGAGRALRARAVEVEGGGAAALVSPAPLDFYDRGPDLPGQFVAEPGSVGRGADVVAAARLLDRPQPRVRALLAAGWARLVDPQTPAGALLRAAGVAAPAPATAAAVAGEAPPCP
jgi:hypothetical protein